MTDRTFSIGEVAAESGIAPSALRYYESIGLLAPVERVNGRRRFDRAALDRLQLVRAAQAVGFTLTEIGALFDSFPERTPLSKRWRTLALKKRAELERQAQQIELMRELLGHLEGCSCRDEAQCAAAMRGALASESAE